MHVAYSQQHPQFDGAEFRLIPVSPTASELIQLEITTFPTLTPTNNPQGVSFDLQRNNNLIQLFVVYQVVGPPVGGLPLEMLRFPLGSLIEGEYSLEVFAVTLEAIFPIDPSTLEPNYTQGFNVSVPPQPVPALGLTALLVMTLGILQRTY